MKRLLIAALASVALNVLAQPLPLNYSLLNEKYKGNNAIVLNREQQLNISTGGKSGLIITSESNQQIYYIDNRSTGIIEKQIPYVPSFYTISSFEANTYVPQPDGKFKKIAVKDYKDEGRVDNGNVFYDGVMYRKFHFSGVTSGSITETKHTYSYEEPGQLGSFYFMWGIPHHQLKYTVSVSNDVEIGYAFFGDSNFVTHTVEQKGKNTTHVWEANDVKELKSYSDDVNDRYYEPHLFVYIKKYKTKKGLTTLYGTVADLYKYDYKYVSKCNASDAIPEIKLVVDSIKAGVKTEAEIMRGIYYWVQSNMKYIAFEDGLGGQIPREANDVFTKRYGDCKDFASLITVMCKQAGVKAYLTFIGTRDLPYALKALPLGYSFDHMIAAAYINNKWVFIDGTSKHTPFGEPSCFIQGKEAMIAISADSFVVEKVPIMSPDFNQTTCNMDLKISPNQVIEGKVNVNLNGYSRSYFVGSLYYTGINKINEQLKKRLEVGNNKCEVTMVTTNNYNNNDSSMVIDYTFTLPDYVKSIDNELYVNIHLNKHHLNDRIDTTENRIAPKDVEYTYFDKQFISLKIPTGYKVKSLPSNSKKSTGNLEYSFEYTQKGDVIYFSGYSRYNKLTVEPTEFESWNKQIDALLKIYKENIILTKVN